MPESNIFTVIELKEKLKSRGAPTVTSKADLIAHLMEIDPTNSWITEEVESDGGRSDPQAEIETREDALRRREIES